MSTGRPRHQSVRRETPQAWLSVRVELVEGRGEHHWPRPGRDLAASPRHTFAQLAVAIDDAFARWDRSHLHEFRLADGTRIGLTDPDFDEDGVIDEQRVTLSRLRAGEQFLYVFDFGDDWIHLCTVAQRKVHPVDVLGIVPDVPLPHFGWGAIPDQYGRRWAEDDGESPVPPDPKLRDLPPLEPHWGPERRRR